MLELKEVTPLVNYLVRPVVEGTGLSPVMS